MATCLARAKPQGLCLSLSSRLQTDRCAWCIDRLYGESGRVGQQPSAIETRATVRPAWSHARSTTDIKTSHFHQKRWLSTSSPPVLQTSKANVGRGAAAATLFEPAKRRSTVELGTSYENFANETLATLFPGMKLDRVGGANDGGIDLRGWWLVPRSSSSSKTKQATQEVSSESTQERGPMRIRVIVQCKAEGKKCGPVHLRELHGTYTAQPRAATTLPSTDPSAPADSAYEETSPDAQVGILVSKMGFSKQANLVATSSPIPIILVHLSFPEDGEQQQQRGRPEDAGQTISILCNEALNKLLGARIEVRISRSASKQQPIVYLDNKRLK